MDVNVELLTTEENKTTKIIRRIGLISVVSLLVILVIFGLFRESIQGKIIFILMYSLQFFIVTLMILGVFIKFSRAGIKSIGKMQFSEDGLTISEMDHSVFYALTDLRRMKISINEYEGEPIYSGGLIIPSSRGVENFFWLNAENKKAKHRFKLINENHHNRLVDRIWEWERKYPTIQTR